MPVRHCGAAKGVVFAAIQHTVKGTWGRGVPFRCRDRADFGIQAAKTENLVREVEPGRLARVGQVVKAPLFIFEKPDGGARQIRDPGRRAVLVVHDAEVFARGAEFAHRLDEVPRRVRTELPVQATGAQDQVLFVGFLNVLLALEFGHGIHPLGGRFVGFRQGRALFRAAKYVVRTDVNERKAAFLAGPREIQRAQSVHPAADGRLLFGGVHGGEGSGVQDRSGFYRVEKFLNCIKVRNITVRQIDRKSAFAEPAGKFGTELAFRAKNQVFREHKMKASKRRRFGWGNV